MRYAPSFSYHTEDRWYEKEGAYLILTEGKG
jgi:hypothetical protein